MISYRYTTEITNANLRQSQPSRRRVAETSRNITARVIERDINGPLHKFLEESRGSELVKMINKVAKLVAKMMPNWLYRQDFAKFLLNRHYNTLLYRRTDRMPMGNPDSKKMMHED
ncbi:hypothetical protein TNCV_4714031 [Trichonephila clavipes]|nr:hypothetical protein TNCV_4714031 [Trichonephila clavipes]